MEKFLLIALGVACGTVIDKVTDRLPKVARLILLGFIVGALTGIGGTALQARSHNAVSAPTCGEFRLYPDPDNPYGRLDKPFRIFVTDDAAKAKETYPHWFKPEGKKDTTDEVEAYTVPVYDSRDEKTRKKVADVVIKSEVYVTTSVCSAP